MYESFERTIETFFINRNFKKIEPISLFNSDDSMLFTGTSTSCFKHMIIGEYKGKLEKQFVIQPCIKTLNLKVDIERTKYSFGTDELTGRAALFYYYYNNILFQIGDIVEILNCKNDKTYLEIGFGINILSMLFNNEKTLITPTTMKPFIDSINIDINYEAEIWADSLIVALEMIQHNSELSIQSKQKHKGTMYLLQRYIKHIIYYSQLIEMNLSAESIASKYYFYARTHEIQKNIQRFVDLFEWQKKVMFNNEQKFKNFLIQNTEMSTGDKYIVGKERYGLLNKHLEKLIK